MPPARKSKANIPKPPKGSGLNPSGLPLEDQVHLPEEQPRTMSFSFNPHDQDGCWQGEDSAPQESRTFPSSSSSAPTFPTFPSSSSSAPSSSSMVQPYWPYPTTDNPPFYPTEPPPSTDPGSSAAAQDPWPYGSAPDDNRQPYACTPFVGTGSAPTPPWQHSPHGAGENQTPPSFPPESSPQAIAQSYTDTTGYNSIGASAPIPRWADDTPDRGANLSMMRSGEIPHSNVMHTLGPARSIQRRESRRMPQTPYMSMSQPPASTQPPSRSSRRSSRRSSAREGPAASSEATLPVAGSPITVPEDTCRKIVNDAKHHIIGVIFSADAMTHQTAHRQALVTEAIAAAIESCGPEFPNTRFISKQHRSEISGNLSSVRGEIIGHSRTGVFTAYKLYPPKYITADPVEYRIAKVQELTGGPDPLLFMHEQYVDENGNTVLAKFQNMFIMGVVTRFVWYWGRALFVTDSESPIQRMKFVFAVAGAATNCALLEQGTSNIFVDPFTGVVHERKFQEILAAFEALDEQGKSELERYLTWVINTGGTQARTEHGREPASFDLL